MTDRALEAARLPTWVAGLLLGVTVLLAGCSNDDAHLSADSAAPATIESSPLATVATAAPAIPTVPVSVPAGTLPVAEATAPATALAPPDGLTVLLQGLDALAPGYHFVITATVNGANALTTEGDQIGLASRQTVTSQGVAVDYIVLPEGTWKGEGEIWEELEDPAPAVDPLAAFRAPTSVTVVGHTPELTTLVANYPAAALGLQGDQAIDVTVELTGATLRSFSYSTPTGAAASRTDITPLLDTTPITSPST